jgi:uncharacterized protein (DUF2336 family)
MVTDKLSREDVDRLLVEHSVEARINAATKVAQRFSLGQLSENQRRIAEEIFRLMARDAEIRVRLSLAFNLKESARVPHDVAITLAKDVESVALPMLQFSRVLTDDDLLEIVSSQNQAKQVAIASRPEVSPTVSEALVDTHNREVVEHLVANDGAEISEQALQTILAEFGGVEDIQGSLVHRARLPMTIAERLVTMVSNQLREHLVANHQLPDLIAADIVSQSRERATMSLALGADRADVEGLVKHLKANGRLTLSIMLRAACIGDTAFFEAGMAALAALPIANVQRLMHDRGSLGFKALYDKAGLPEALFPAFRCALDVVHETQYDGGERDRERYRRRVLERILTQYEKLNVMFDSDDLEYLLAKLGYWQARMLTGS